MIEILIGAVLGTNLSAVFDGLVDIRTIQTNQHLKELKDAFISSTMVRRTSYIPEEQLEADEVSRKRLQTKIDIWNSMTITQRDDWFKNVSVYTPTPEEWAAYISVAAPPTKKELAAKPRLGYA
jgi:hypothetical protein